MQYFNNPKIGLVLGSGGARGYAHLGVIKVLYEKGIHIDLIVWTSFGSIFGAAYAAGCDIYELKKIALVEAANHALHDIKIKTPNLYSKIGLKIEGGWSHNFVSK